MVRIVGPLGELETGVTPSGRPTARFYVQVQPRLRCDVFGNLALALAANGHQGAIIEAQGQLLQERYLDKSTGEKRTAWKVAVSAISLAAFTPVQPEANEGEPTPS